MIGKNFRWLLLLWFKSDGGGFATSEGFHRTVLEMCVINIDVCLMGQKSHYTMRYHEEIIWRDEGVCLGCAVAQ